MSSEREELETLITSPGWLLLTGYARKNWRDRYPERIKLAISRAKADGEDLASAVNAIDAETEAINLLLSFPQSRIETLIKMTEREHAEPLLSRRGGL